MSNKEILEKAIQKAIDGGWDAEGLGGVETWQEDLTELERQHVIQLMFFREGLGDGYKLLIFNHDFAKALYGDRYFNAYEDDQAVTEEFGCMDAYVCDLHTGPRWKIHLRNMVVSEDPIEYLGEHLDVQKQD